MGDEEVFLGDLDIEAIGNEDFLRVEPRLLSPRISSTAAPSILTFILSVSIVSTVTLSVSVVEREKCTPAPVVFSGVGVVRPWDTDLPRGDSLFARYGILRIPIGSSPGSDEDCDGRAFP